MQVSTNSSEGSLTTAAPQSMAAPSLEQQSLDTAKGDIPAAIIVMTQTIMKDSACLAENLETIVKTYAEHRIRVKASLWRYAIANANYEGVAKGRASSNLAIAMKAEATRFMNMPLFGGKPIGQATVDEIRESARRYALVSDDMRRKSAWQSAVAEKLVDSGAATVAEGLQEADLASLWNKI